MMPLSVATARLFGHAKTRECLKGVDWSAFGLGAPEHWPAALMTTVETVMHCSFPMFVAWGPELLTIYNEAYAAILGDKHPAAMGQPMRHTWAGSWPEIGPIVEQALAGTSAYFEDFELHVKRGGQLETACFTFSYSPIYGGADQVAGLLGIVSETTGSVVLKKRQAFRLELVEKLRELIKPDAITAAASRLLGQHLKAARVLYANVDDAADTFDIRNDWTDGSVTSLAGMSGSALNFGKDLFEDASSGCTVAIADTATDARTHAHAAAYAGIGVQSLLVVPLVKNGRLIATLNIHRCQPYHWSRADISLSEDTAQHTWAAIERAKAEHALTLQVEAEVARLREFFELSTSAIAVLSGENHVFDYVNEAYQQMTGRRDLVGLPLRQALPDAMGQGFEALMNDVFRTGKPSHALGVALMLQPGPDRPARTLHVDFQYQPRLAANGRVMGIFAQGHDVSEAYFAQSALRESEARFKAAVSAIGIMWTNNAAGEMRGPQPGWTAITGQTEADYGGYGWTHGVHEDDVEATLRAWSEAVRQRGVFSFEHRLRTVRRGWRIFSIRAVPIVRGDGSIVEWVGVHIDITDARQAEEALKETDRRKDEFVATLAHELRNPLAAIRTAAHVLGSDRALPDAQRIGLHDTIARQAGIMALLLDDLLDVSRISNGRFELRRESVELKTIVETAIEAARPLIDAKHHQFTASLPQEPLIVHADPLRLSQVLTNILTNSAKYTDTCGQIYLSVIRDDSGIYVAVKDNGIGIDQQALPYIFDMFSQVKSAIDRSEGGLGIGLSLARGLVRLHGGTIYAQSDGPGRGSEVTVHLPLDLLQQTAPAGHGAGPAHTGPALTTASWLSVLVVDDNVDAAETFAMMLRLDGHQVLTAHRAVDALNICERSAIDVAILDIGMPGMTGHELARRIRQEPWGQHLLLIALTGWGQTSDKRQAMEAGFDHHFTKPVDPDEITRLLMQHSEQFARLD